MKRLTGVQKLSAVLRAGLLIANEVHANSNDRQGNSNHHGGNSHVNSNDDRRNSNNRYNNRSIDQHGGHGNDGSVQTAN